jgi:membrane fusion protein, copper/silver efflux system
MKITNKLVALAGLVFLAVAVLGIIGCNNSGQKQSDSQAGTAKQYTCSMHPEVVQDKPGKCPKCGMELVEKH